MNDYKSFFIKLSKEPDRMFLNRNFGVKVIEITSEDEIDDIIFKLSDNMQGTKKIFISNEAASFSNKLNVDYKNKKNLKIIII